MKSAVRTACLASLAACAALPAAAQGETPANFVVMLGRDTVAVEQYVRSPGHLSSHLVTRAPRTVLRRLDADLRPDGRVRRLVMHSQVMNDPTLLPQVVTVTMGNDSSDVRIVRGDTVRELRVATPGGAWPYVGDSYALVEHALRGAGTPGRDSTVVALLPPGARATAVGTLRRLPADSVSVRLGPNESRVAFTGGRIQGVRSPNSTRQVDVQRVRPFSAWEAAHRFAEAERRGGGLGNLSPRDSVSAGIGGANVSVAYGRPSRRGRTIGGGVVQYGRVWRTGANDATSFRTDRDLLFGDVRVPAGSYTLFTVPRAEGWHLIVNRRTGQWGTEYDAAQDLAHVPMRAHPATEQPEQLTMRLEPAANGGVLVLSWGDVSVAAPFTVAP